VVTSSPGGRLGPPGAGIPSGAAMMAALESISEGVVITDGSGQPRYRNRAARTMLPEGPEGALAWSVAEELLKSAWEREPVERQVELVSPARRTLLFRAYVVGGGEEGDPALAEGRFGLVVVEDVSERRRLEAIRRDFVANVSHELKTPTGALTLLAETVEGEEDPEVVRRLVKRMGTEAERLGRIIDDLLDLSRIEANEAPVKAPVAVSTVVAEVVEALQSVASSLGVTLEVDKVPPGVAVPGERRDLVSALMNLVDNGIKYSEPGGVVRISAQDRQDRVDISVTDQGVGIPPRDLERIFERFYRVDRARSRATGGTGLGLSIVRHVAANHGGSVRVSSVEGEGSTFVLELPAVRLGGPDGPQGGMGGKDG